MIKLKNLFIACVGLVVVLFNCFFAFLVCGSGISWADERFFCQSARFFLTFPFNLDELESGFAAGMILQILFYFIFFYLLSTLILRLLQNYRSR